MGGGGYSLVEAALALALLGLSAAAAVPALTASLARARVAAAARRVCGDLARLRGEAITTRRVRGLRLEQRDGAWRYTIHEDGDGDGLRSDDIAAGRDPAAGPAFALGADHTGVDFRLLDVAVPEIPPGSGTLTAGSDPVRFARSDLISFSPRGTSSSGTFYISDGHRALFAVVLYGGTGRIRVWRYDREQGRWRQ